MVAVDSCTAGLAAYDYRSKYLRHGTNHLDAMLGQRISFSWIISDHADGSYSYFL